jgi:tetratricopeptide (TPR) repeat protein
VLKNAFFAVLFTLAAAAPLAAAEDWNALIKAAIQAQKKGDLKEAEAKLLKAQLAAEDFGPQDPRAAYTLDYLGTLYAQRGDLSDALAVYERARAGFEASLGADSSEAIESAARLAEAYGNAGQWAKAEPHYRAALTRARAKQPADPVTVAAAATDLGLSVDAQGRYDEALKLYKEAEGLRRQALGPESSELAECLNNEGRAYLMKGDLKQAEKLIRQALAIDEKALGESHPSVSDDLRRLSAVLFKAGKKDESGQLGARAEKLDQERQTTPSPKPLPQP